MRFQLRRPWGLWVAHETTWLGEQTKPQTPQLEVKMTKGGFCELNFLNGLAIAPAGCMPCSFKQ